MITQKEFSEHLQLLPSTFIRKVWGQERRICSLILGVKETNMDSTTVQFVTNF